MLVAFEVEFEPPAVVTVVPDTVTFDDPEAVPATAEVDDPADDASVVMLVVLLVDAVEPVLVEDRAELLDAEPPFPALIQIAEVPVELMQVEGPASGEPVVNVMGAHFQSVR